MRDQILPYITEANQLHAELKNPELVIIDLGHIEDYQKAHVPGAIHLDISCLRRETRPAAGLVPPLSFLTNTLRRCGVTHNRHVVAYDHGNNADACRLLWTLCHLGQHSHSLLNGGMTGWKTADYAVESSLNQPQMPKFSPDFSPAIDPSVIADKDYVVAALSNPDIQILDARSKFEHLGMKSASSVKGRIPGAINIDWMETIDGQNSRKFLPAADLDALVTARGLHRDKEIITHCQTHMRSSHSFVMLKSIGFTRVRGYPGSWAEWASDPDLPKETGG